MVMIEIVSYSYLPEKAKQIREDVFIKEQGFAVEFDFLDEKCTHFILYENGIACGTCRIYFDEKERRYHLGRLAVSKSKRGKGFGRALVEASEAEIKRKGHHHVVLSAQQRVVPFYEAIGYRCVGETYLDEFCPHIQMVKDLV